jgi:hypothetical protein
MGPARPVPAQPLPPAAEATSTPGLGGLPVRLPQGGTGEIVPGEVVVRFRPPPGNQPTTPDRPQTILQQAGVPSKVARALAGTDGFVVAVPSGQEAQAAEALADSPDVIAASPNLVRHIHTRPLQPAPPPLAFHIPQSAVRNPQYAPNDPLYPVQWGYGRVNAPGAWNFSQRPVTVAVLDTGLDATHPEFAGRVAPGANYVRLGQPPADDNGHGTHVAGIIAAAGGNGVGGLGMAWQARIMPIKVADSSGNLTSEAWLNGITFAVNNGAQVLNMSFGGTTYSSTEQAYITDAWNHGVVLVASAGNSGDSGNPVEYPAAYVNVISVAATGPDNTRAYYSESNNAVTVAAPGGDARFSNDPVSHFVVSTWPLGLGSNYQTGYAMEIGTSQSAPFVSGLAALMLGTNAAWSNATLVERIERTATDLGAPGRDDGTGYGLINVAAAVGNPPGPPAPPTVPPPPTATTAPPPPAPLTPPPTVTPRPTDPPRPTPTPTLGPGCLFTDLCPGNAALPFVQDLVRRGAVSGYGDRSFRPSLPLTRGAAAKLVVLARGVPLAISGVPAFADVPLTAPLAPYIVSAARQGLIAGYPDGSFQPDRPITRGQLAKLIVLARGWQLVDPGISSFPDVAYGSPLSYYMETVVAYQVMPTFPDRTFRPDLPVTRGEAARYVDVALATFRP